MQHFGMAVDSFKYYLGTSIQQDRVTFTESQYNMQRLSADSPFYNVTSSWQGLPNFMVWQDNLLNLDNWLPLSSKTVFDTLAPYMANMTDEERYLFDPTITQLVELDDIRRISCTRDTVEIYTFLDGKPKLLLVTVMNMIDTSARNMDTLHWKSRSSLN